MTLVYGHNMDNGDMFGEMKNYSKEEYFKQNNRLKIYLSHKEKEYELVAALPFDDRHIMYSYNFEDKVSFENFVYELNNVRHLNANFNDEVTIGEDDKLVVLSTCYYNVSNKRFLIVWRELENDEKISEEN